MRRLRTFAVVSASVLVIAALAGTSAHADEQLDPPGGLHVVGVPADSVTVAWDAVPDAEKYSVGLLALEAMCGGSHQSVITSDLTATFTGLSPDCRYRVAVQARDFTAYPWQYSDHARVEFTTPLPDGYEFPEPPNELRIEQNAAGELTGFAWDPVSTGADPVKYIGYVDFEPDFLDISGRFFGGDAQTHFRDDPNTPWDDFDEFLDLIGMAPSHTVKVWVTTVDGIHHESAPSNQLVLACEFNPSTSHRSGVSCVPAQ